MQTMGMLDLGGGSTQITFLSLEVHVLIVILFRVNFTTIQELSI